MQQTFIFGPVIFFTSEEGEGIFELVSYFGLLHPPPLLSPLLTTSDRKEVVGLGFRRLIGGNLKRFLPQTTRLAFSWAVG